jgi:hypothetical protein
MLEKVATLFIGIALIFGGVQAFFVRGYRSVMWGRYMDYGPYHQVIGVIFIIGGLFIVYKETRIIIRDKRKGRPPREGG